MQIVIAYVAAALVFFALDMVWLAGVAKDFYFSRLGDLIRPTPDYLVAGVFYAGYVAGIVYFAVAPALAGGGMTRALINGALIGLLAYGTYDATNLATLRGYPAEVAIVDVIWGTFLTAAAASAGYLAAARFAD
ncbi:MAG TPA: DUF2177 family protein [Parvularculaceae bacterium]|nr:DUF2177 family protein [Parvularculaceae bacterium]